MKAFLVLAVLVLAVAPEVSAQEPPRPTEEDLFGQPAKPAAAEPAPQAPAGDRAGTEADLFGAPQAPQAPERTVTREKEDPLRVGGQLYLRGQTTWFEELDPADWPLTSPNLLDVYLDARPNDRVRGFVLGRMSYDPTGGASGT